MDGYPKTLYPRVGGGSVTVDSPEQEKRLGDGWVIQPPFPILETSAEPAIRQTLIVQDEPKRKGRPKKEVVIVEAT